MTDKHEAVETVEPFLDQLRRVNLERYEAWIAGGDDAGIMFDALELGGEVGELLNVVKKLEREERGWRGSRVGDGDFADECADVLICLDKLARRRGVDLTTATVAKFNATSEKVGLPQRLALSSIPSDPAGGDYDAARPGLSQNDALLIENLRHDAERTTGRAQTELRQAARRIEELSALAWNPRPVASDARVRELEGMLIDSVPSRDLTVGRYHEISEEIRRLKTARATLTDAPRGTGA